MVPTLDQCSRVASRSTTSIQYLGVVEPSSPQCILHGRHPRLHRVRDQRVVSIGVTVVERPIGGHVSGRGAHPDSVPRVVPPARGPIAAPRPWCQCCAPASGAAGLLDAPWTFKPSRSWGAQSSGTGVTGPRSCCTRSSSAARCLAGLNTSSMTSSTLPVRDVPSPRARPKARRAPRITMTSNTRTPTRAWMSSRDLSTGLTLREVRGGGPPGSSRSLDLPVVLRTGHDLSVDDELGCVLRQVPRDLEGRVPGSVDVVDRQVLGVVA